MEILFYVWLGFSFAVAALTFILDDDVTIWMAARFFFTWPLMLVVWPYFTFKEWMARR